MLSEQRSLINASVAEDYVQDGVVCVRSVVDSDTAAALLDVAVSAMKRAHGSYDSLRRSGDLGGRTRERARPRLSPAPDSRRGRRRGRRCGGRRWRTSAAASRPARR